MSKHRAALQEMGSESITGIVDLVSGEKDPRNLMVIFSILKVIMVEWDISRHAEVGILTTDSKTLLTRKRIYSTPSSATSQSPFVLLPIIRMELLHKTSRIVYVTV